jgi:chaperone required for assembly of F1-ATPase
VNADSATGQGVSLPRRFYEGVSIAERDGGYAVLLDGRPVRTPARKPVVLPTPALAEALAEEWRAQQGVIDPGLMPIARLVNSALDGVADAMEAVRADVARFAGADLLCYRAEGPQSLVDAQHARWDPLVRWAGEALGLDFVLAAGVVHVSQPPRTLERAEAALVRYGPLGLAALHVMATLTGSVVLALAVAHGRLTAAEAWEAAHLDEDWQMSQWGRDAEAMRRRESRWRDMQGAARVARLLRD